MNLVDLIGKRVSIQFIGGDIVFVKKAESKDVSMPIMTDRGIATIPVLMGYLHVEPTGSYFVKTNDQAGNSLREYFDPERVLMACVVEEFVEPKAEKKSSLIIS